MHASALSKLHRATDRRAGELISITPMTSGGYLPGAPTDVPAEARAYVTETSTAVRTSGNSANSGHNVELLGATHTARFETSQIPFTVQVGHIVIRIHKDGAPRLRVAAAYPLGTDRTILVLVKLP